MTKVRPSLSSSKPSCSPPKEKVLPIPAGDSRGGGGDTKVGVKEEKKGDDRGWAQVVLSILGFVASVVCILVLWAIQFLASLGAAPPKMSNAVEERKRDDGDKAKQCQGKVALMGQGKVQMVTKEKAEPKKLEIALSVVVPRRKKISISVPKPVKVVEVELSREEKINQLFPEVLEYVLPFLEYDDLHSLRQVSKPFKSAADSIWTASLDTHLISLPSVYLTDLHKVSTFTKQLSAAFSPFPFEVLVGGGSPSDPDYHDCDDVYMDQLSCQVFWRAFSLCAKKVGHQFRGLVLDVRIDPQFGFAYTETICSEIIHQCLPHLTNLRYLVFITNTVNVEKALSSVYSVKDPPPTHYPVFSNLESLEILTLSEGHPSKSKFKTRSITFPSRFLRQHGSTLKGFRIYGNLYDFKSMGVFQAPELEWMHYEIHHCHCQGKDAELKALLALPVVEQEGEKKNLRDISVKINWQWRTSDMSSLFKWLGRNYQGHLFDKITLVNSQNPMKHGFRHDAYEAYLKQIEEKGSSAYGSDFPWLSTLSLPPVRTLHLLTEYEGNWLFLKPLRGSLERIVMIKQKFFRNEEEMKARYRRGLLWQVFGEDLVSETDEDQRLWEYFPRLKEIVVIWRAINFKFVNWDIEKMLQSDEYKQKKILLKMKWVLTRDEVMGI